MPIPDARAGKLQWKPRTWRSRDRPISRKDSLNCIHANHYWKFWHIPQNNTIRFHAMCCACVHRMHSQHFFFSTGFSRLYVTQETSRRVHCCFVSTRSSCRSHDRTCMQPNKEDADTPTIPSVRNNTRDTISFGNVHLYLSSRLCVDDIDWLCVAVINSSSGRPTQQRIVTAVTTATIIYVDTKLAEDDLKEKCYKPVRSSCLSFF